MSDFTRIAEQEGWTPERQVEMLLHAATFGQDPVEYAESEASYAHEVVANFTTVVSVCINPLTRKVIGVVVNDSIELNAERADDIIVNEKSPTPTLDLTIAKAVLDAYNSGGNDSEYLGWEFGG